MDAKLYNAAVFGDIDVLMEYKDKFAIQVTPNNNNVLHLVSRAGITKCVPKILSINSSLLYEVNSKGESALHLAARHGQHGVVLELIKHAVSLDEGLEGGVGSAKEMLRMRNENGNTTLHDAVQFHHVEVVKILTREDHKYSHNTNKNGETPLSIAAKRGYHDLVAVILETCTSPDYRSSVGKTALHEAIISNSEVSTRLLLEWNQSLIYKRDERGWSPLHYAAFHGHTNRISQLLNVDKSIAYLEDSDKNTALHVATIGGHSLSVLKLLKLCPDCGEMVNGKGKNILHIALEQEEFDTFMYIIKMHVEIIDGLIIETDNDGITPFHLMAAVGLHVDGLTDHGMVDREKFTLLHKVADDCFPVQDEIQELTLPPLPPLSPMKITIKQMKESLKNEMRTLKENSTGAYQIRKKKKKELLMKTSDTSMIVAALVATVTFAAGFTMPGGYYQSGDANQGMAVLAKKTAFQAFMVSDTIALLLSSTSVFISFWGTRTRGKIALLNIARLSQTLVTAAIGAMMIAFSTGTYVVLAQLPALAIATCVIGVISFPMCLLSTGKIEKDARKSKSESFEF